ncbi:MAG: ABC transporter substrate-binding protein, partial [Minisyncoccales bacterium]
MSNLKEKFFSFFKKWPSKSQWKRFFFVLNKKELILFLILLFVFITSGIILLVNLYLSNTKVVPTRGGTYKEAIVGSPRYINPVYAQHSDVDRDLTELIFSGLLKYNGKGELIMDLAKDYEVLENGKVFRFDLKENAVWHDGKLLTAEDIVFTIETIQDPNTKSHLRPDWTGVEVKKLSKYSVEFSTSRTSSTFLQNCTAKIIPKHIWENIAPENFALSNYNLNPIGSGPYKLDEAQQNDDNKIKQLSLVSFDNYYDEKPYIPKVSFNFVNEKEDLVKSYQNKTIDGYGSLSKDLSPNNKKEVYHPSYPQYFALFFNTESDSIVENIELRKALNYSIDKEKLIEKFGGEIVNSPILPKVFGFKTASTSYPFDKEKATTLIEDLGYTETNEEGIKIKVETDDPSFQFSSRLQQGQENSEVEKLQECLADMEDIYPEGSTSGYFGNKTKEAVIRFQEKHSEEILEPWGYTSGTG